MENQTPSAFALARFHCTRSPAVPTPAVTDSVEPPPPAGNGPLALIHISKCSRLFVGNAWLVGDTLSAFVLLSERLASSRSPLVLPLSVCGAIGIPLLAYSYAKMARLSVDARFSVQFAEESVSKSSANTGA